MSDKSRAGRAHRGLGTRADRRVHRTALAVTAVLHLGFATVLMRPTAGAPETAPQDEVVMQVVFIERIPDPLPVKTPAVEDRPRRTTSRARKPKAESRMRAVPAGTLPDATPSRPARRLDLAIAPGKFDFRRSPVERASVPLDATTTLLHVRMRDTSLGGRLQSMAQQRICGELRSALARNPESTASILGALQRHGCAI